MLRLPRERMLDAAIARDEVASDDVARVAQVLSAFYHRCEPVPMPLEDYLARLQQEVDLCRSELDAVDSDLDHAMVRRTADRLRGFLGRGARLQAGRMVEGHGDLRPEHICLLPVPVVIDCLEFNRDLRLLDVADELSHLEIECARIGGRSVGRSLFAQVSGDLADAVPPGLKAFYCGYRAFTRARLAAWHNIDAPAADPTRWTRRAREYLALAEDYAGAG
jgi:aminoglycoside phosphotransferase family enzyme